jgi:hypothetical protein
MLGLPSYYRLPASKNVDELKFIEKEEKYFEEIHKKI